MSTDLKSYIPQLTAIFESGIAQISTIKPSEWTEKNVVMGKPRPGAFRYDYTPYAREIVDRFSGNDPARVVAVMKGAQIGFALDVDTDIPTPDGFRKMKEIQKGDYVFNEFGMPVLVTMATEIMHNHNCYKVTFTDGTDIIADAEHLWTVKDLKNVERVLTTEQISKRVKKVSRTNKERSRYHIINSAAVSCSKKDLPIDPYLLGLWLGDGSTTSNTITATYKDAIFYKEELYKRGILVNITPYKDAPDTCHVRVQNVFNGWKGGNNIYGNKHIPEIYFTASIDQRLDLLQGLIDTDGHVMEDGKVEFYNINKSLILQVKTLISSLGYKVTIRERDNSGKLTNMHPTRKYKMKNIFVLNFMGVKEMPVAKLPRKKDRLRSISKIRQEVTKRWIKSVTKIDSVPVKCISVESKTHLYLASKSYIPTHNSSGVLVPGMGWMIQNNPGNTYFMVGAPDLIPKAVEKLDLMIDGAGLRPYIKPATNRKRANKSGDTNEKKDFSGGYIGIGSATNHKAIAQVDLQYILLDDLDAMKGESESSGNLIKLIEKRAAAYKDIYKMFLISTPLLKSKSLIEPAYLLGDRRKYFIECECCHKPIILKWSVLEGEVINHLTNEVALCNGGMTWDADSHGRVDEKSVRYVCYLCGGAFNDKRKYEMLNGGIWQPTFTPSKESYFSYHIPSLYAPIGMFDWLHCVRDYVECNPVDQPRKEGAHKVFVNTVLGETYESSGIETTANSIQRNKRNYKIGTIPEKLSISDGNGKIILLTCASDMNGTVDDARLDWEIVAWSASGASYSIAHGSIGTFIPREGSDKFKADREKFSYRFEAQNNVWDAFTKIIRNDYPTDTGRVMKIYQTGLDCGYFSTNYAYPFVDKSNPLPYIYVVGLKGKGEEEYIKYNRDLKYFKPASERPNLYILTVGKIKDELAEAMQLTWNEKTDKEQPYGFMNFPNSEGGMYEFTNYFEHFQSEHCVTESNKDGTGTASRWQKKSGNVMNHMWDVRVYNMAMKEIIVDTFRKELKLPKMTWKEFVVAVTGGK